jgi:hypothetical protein
MWNPHFNRDGTAIVNYWLSPGEVRVYRLGPGHFSIDAGR